MRRRALLLAFCLLAPFGCKKEAPKGVPGSGVQAKKSRPVPTFSRVWVGGALNVWVTVGKDGPMELKGDDNLLDHVTAKVEKGELRLNTDTKLLTKMPLELRLSTTELSAVTAVVASRVEVLGLKAKKFEAHAGGAGRITASGSAEEVVASGNGATQLDLTELPASSAKVVVEKAASVKLGYIEKLDVKASGASRVIYSGDPEIVKDVKKPAFLIQQD